MRNEYFNIPFSTFHGVRILKIYPRGKALAVIMIFLTDGQPQISASLSPALIVTLHAWERKKAPIIVRSLIALLGKELDLETKVYCPFSFSPNEAKTRALNEGIQTGGTDILVYAHKSL